MSEKISSNPVYYTKDFSDWGNDQNNFVANQELTVTITLNEYRNLVKDNASNKTEIELEKAKKHARELEDRLTVLKAQNADLIRQLKGDEDGVEHDS